MRLLLVQKLQVYLVIFIWTSGTLPVTFLTLSLGQEEDAKSALIHLGCYLRDGAPPRHGSDHGHPISPLQPINNSSTNPTNLALLDLWFSPRESDKEFKDPQSCVKSCKHSLFRYAGLYKVNMRLRCLCGSSYGRNGGGTCVACVKDPSLHCGSEESTSIYDTGFKVPSPPQQIMLLHRTETSLHISWVQPLAPNGALTGYQITAKAVYSYSHSPAAFTPKNWQGSESEQEMSLMGLVPGSQYEVTVSAENSEGVSSPISANIWTKVGVPDPPTPPKILREDPKKGTMTLELKSSRNTKGPVSTYRLALIDESQPIGFFNKDRPATWNESKHMGFPYYIAAELSPDEVSWSGRKFLVGDRRYYGGFYNGPLPEGQWRPALGIISSMDGFTEVSFSSTAHSSSGGSSGPLDHDSERAESLGLGLGHPNRARGGIGSSSGRGGDRAQREDGVEVIEENSGLVLGLWIAIGISGLILLACVAAFLVLKLNLFPKRRTPSTPDRRVENHQLTTRDSSFTFPESAVAYTHAGFIHDEDVRNMCLEKLKQVWYVPRNFMGIPGDEEQGVQLIGNGRYGQVYLSSLKTNGSPVTLYSVPASSFQTDKQNKNLIPEDPQKLYGHLEELVRIEPQENVVKLIGFMEDGDTLLFAVEFGGIPLKNWLLQYRQFDDSTKTDPVKPSSLLLCAMNIAEAMFHIHSFKVTHGQLATCNVLVNDIENPKVTGFGLLSYNSLKEERDYTRWNAVEQFQNRCVKSCDLWSFGVTLWELVTLGGTPYHDIRNEDLSMRLCRGHRLPQLEIMGDPLYQIMLNCWQIDRDERPDFGSLSCSIHQILPTSKDNLFISSSFMYPPYVHHYETIKSSS